MGEMADYYIDVGLQQEMDGYDDEYGYEDESLDFGTFHRTTMKVCKYCNEGNLHWGKQNDKWRLFDSENRLHKCAE